MTVLDLGGSKVSMPVFIIVSSVRVSSTHDSLRPTRRPRLTSWRYGRMARRFVARRSLDLSRILFSGRFCLAKACTATIS